MRPSPLPNHPSAVTSTSRDPDQVVPAHLDDPGREQTVLAEGRVVYTLTRDVVTVAGPDRLSWLITLSSQVLTGLKSGDGGMETLLLDAQSHITHALTALDDGHTLWLVTEAGRDEALAIFLDSMCFMLRVEVTERLDVVALGALGEGLGVLAQTACGTTPDASGLLAEAGDTEPQGSLIGLWRDPWLGVVEGGTSYDIGVGRPHPGETYRGGFVLVSAQGVNAVVSTFLAAGEGRRLAGALAWEALRTEVG